MGRWIATAMASLMAAFLVLGVDWVESDAPGDPGAAKALDAVTTATFDVHHPAASFPDDWQNVMGYLPATAIGPQGRPILIKPTGDCSSPLGPTDYNFDAVCKEHDLSYDVLRYSQRVGDPLPAAARRAADDMFGRELHARCVQQRVSGLGFVACHTLAESFVDVVRVNSWRQGFRPPGTENGWQWASVVLLALALLGVRAGRSILRRRALGWSVLALDLLPALPCDSFGRLERLLFGIPTVPPAVLRRSVPSAAILRLDRAAA